ncbi:hypothetical protein CDA63_00560 [Hymenobacter amundsenii]|uniref:Uncharacterized protein n=1 Tax=Hymenobacter amundsenii TaxID=2006685 RepID=A0A246FT06_9BACT|nr:hypothetical protein [Hymenobacter amundsenii]OWP64884.1 hypothetical protein CDA63_00560 [Hymenobacter amundsenii]
MTLVWSILNLLLIALIFYAFWRVFKLIGQQVGKGIAVLFMVGLFGFRGGSSKSEETINENLVHHTRVSNFHKAPLLTYVTRPIGNQLKLYVRASYRANDPELTPVRLTASVNGLVAGHEWTPMGGVTNIDRDSVPTYEIRMIHRWNLLNYNMFTEFETYEGTLPKPGKMGPRGTVK